MKKSGRERESYCSVGTARLIVHKLLKQRTKLERVSLSFFVCALLLDTCEIRRLNPGRFPFRQNFRLEIPETFRVKWKGFPAIEPLFCNFIARVNQNSNKMDVAALPVLCENFDEEIESLSKGENNFDFKAIAVVFCCFAKWNLKRVQISIWVYRCRYHFERYDKKWKDKLRLPVNNAHQQTLEMAWQPGGKNSRRQPQAETKLRKWNGNFCSNRLERKKRNTSEGRPLVLENFQANRARHLHLNPSNTKFCLNGKSLGSKSAFLY